MNVPLVNSDQQQANGSFINVQFVENANRKRAFYVSLYAFLLVMCVLLAATRALAVLESAEALETAETSNSGPVETAPFVMESAEPEVRGFATASKNVHEIDSVSTPAATSAVEPIGASESDELVPVPDTQFHHLGSRNSRAGLAGRVSGSPERHPGPFHDQMVTPANFTYLGAFRPPHVQGMKSDFAFGGAAIALNPAGDSASESNGLPGSLFIVGNPSDELVAEISIPRPVISQERRLEDLPQAKVLQPFADLTGGVRNHMTQGSSEPFRIGGLHVSGGRIHWTLYKYYNVETVDYPSHATSSLILASPDVRGLWHLGPSDTGRSEWHSYKHAGYIFDIPESFANTWFAGRNLISGLQIATGFNIASHGPAIFAYRLLAPGTLFGASLDAAPLVYNDIDRPATDFHPADRWTGAAWLSVEGRDAVIVAGRKALGPVYYGDARPIDCTVDKGYHGTPYEAQIRFYAPQSLIAAAYGRIAPTAMDPWYVWNDKSPGGGFSKYLFPSCSQHLGGVAYDRVNNLIYIVQSNAGATLDAPYDIMPVIHVFRLS